MSKVNLNEITYPYVNIFTLEGQAEDVGGKFTQSIFVH